MTDDPSEPGEPKLAFTKAESDEVMPTLTWANDKTSQALSGAGRPHAPIGETIDLLETPLMSRSVP